MKTVSSQTKEKAETTGKRQRPPSGVRIMKGKGRILKSNREKTKIKPLDKQMEVITRQAFKDNGMGRTHKATLEESSSGSSC